VDVALVDASDNMDVEGFKNWQTEYLNVQFIKKEDKTFKVVREVEKMSKSKYNVVNPDSICEEYGADSLRLYEMFLGPLEQSKPWNTAGITGVYGFLKKLWRLYHSGRDGQFKMDDSPSEVGEDPESFKTLHRAIKEVEDGIDPLSCSPSVAAYVACVNELAALDCNDRIILDPLAILISPYAPLIAEELASRAGHTTSIATVPLP